MVTILTNMTKVLRDTSSPVDLALSPRVQIFIGI